MSLADGINYEIEEISYINQNMICVFWYSEFLGWKNIAPSFCSLVCLITKYCNTNAHVANVLCL